MISNQSRTKEWIIGIRANSPGRDPILIEKMIMALTLVENLRLSGLDFIFKGGTSLILLLGMPQRFSIDIDIVLTRDQNLDEYIQAVLDQGVFHRVEENKRAGDLPKQHYKFFYNSVIQGKESHILLDILFDEDPYPTLQEVNIVSPLITVTEETTRVTCPALECLLGDKLTAFAPHTTGISYGVGKELEIAKQLYDVAILFDASKDVKLVGAAFENIALKQLSYRAMREQTSTDVLMDVFYTAVLIGMRGSSSSTEYAELLDGFKKLAAFVYSGFFSLDSAILCASKAAYLSALIVNQKDSIQRFENNQDISSLSIVNSDYSKLNKLKKTSPEAFYYFYLALDLLERNGA
jgi:predicted nucleotidyltransferase component of viral defense system